MGELDADLAALGWALRALPPGSTVTPLRALWIGARPGLDLPDGLQIEALQDFTPWCDALSRAGYRCLPPAAGDGLQASVPVDRQHLVLLSPARQREAARAEAARALAALAEDGLLLASVANDAGARAFEADLRLLCPTLEVHSKHKCRVLIARAAGRDVAQMAAWRDLDAARPLRSEGLVSTALLGAPGLFAVDRIDAGSALLIEHLPTTLAGAVADLGSGLGVLSAAALERCPGITSLDLFEASARAVALSRYNLRTARVPGRRSARPSCTPPPMRSTRTARPGSSPTPTCPTRPYWRSVSSASTASPARVASSCCVPAAHARAPENQAPAIRRLSRTARPARARRRALWCRQ